jgi:hypothetical protein
VFSPVDGAVRDRLVSARSGIAAVIPIIPNDRR